MSCHVRSSQSQRGHCHSVRAVHRATARSDRCLLGAGAAAAVCVRNLAICNSFGPYVVIGRLPSGPPLCLGRHGPLSLSLVHCQIKEREKACLPSFLVQPPPILFLFSAAFFLWTVPHWLDKGPARKVSRPR